MADKEILINTKIDINYQDAEKELKKIDAKIKNIERKRTITFEMQSSLESQIRELETTFEKEKEKLSNMNVFAFSQDEINQQKSLVSSLQSQYNKMANSIYRYEDALDKSTSEIKQLESEAAQYKQVIADSVTAGTEGATNSQNKLGASVKNTTDEIKEQGNTATISLGNAENSADRVSNAIQKFGDRLKGLVKRVFVFTLITSGLRKVREWFGNVLKANSQMQNALANLKGALYTLVTPIVNTVIPILVKLINMITTVIYYIEYAITALTGFQFSSIVTDAQNIYNAANGTADSLADANDNAKELKRTLASFDTLEILDKNNDSDSLDTGSLSGGSAGAPNWSFSQMITEEMKELALYAESALLLLGIILLFSGASIPLGLGLIAVGALGLAGQVMADWDTVKEIMSGTFGDALIITSTVMLVLGVILMCIGGSAFSWGLGLIVAGAVGLASQAIFNQNKLIEVVTGAMAVPLQILGITAIVFGILLICAGLVAKGIGLLILGIGTTGSQIIWNPDGFKKLVQTPLAGTIITIAGYVALAFGVIMICAGRIALGIGALCMGIVGLVAMGTWNPNALKDLLSKPLVGELLTIAGYVAIALGIILICATRYLVGITLLVTGLVDLYTQSAYNKNGLSEMLKGPLGIVITIASYLAVAFGIILICTGRIGTGITLLITGIAGMFHQTNLNPNGLQEVIKGPLGIVFDIVGYASIAIGLILICTGHIGVGITMIVNGFAAGIFKETTLDENSSGFAQVASMVVGGISSALLVKMAASGVKNLLSKGFTSMIGGAVEGATGDVSEIVSNGISSAIQAGGTSTAVETAATTVGQSFGVAFVAAAVGIITAAGISKAEVTDPNVHNSDAEVGRNRNITPTQNDFWATYASDMTYVTSTLMLLDATLKATTGDIDEQEQAVIRFAKSCGYSYDEITNSLTATVTNSEGAIETITFDLNGLSATTIAAFIEMQNAASEAGTAIPANIVLGILTGKISVEDATDELLKYIGDGVETTGESIKGTVGSVTDSVETQTSKTAETVKKQHSDVRKSIQDDADEIATSYEDANNTIDSTTTTTTDNVKKKHKQTKDQIVDDTTTAANTITDKLGSNSSAITGVNTAIESIGQTAENELGSNSTLTNAVTSGESDSEDVWDSATDWRTFLVDYTNEFDAVFGTTGTVVENARLGWAAILNMFKLGGMALSNALEPIRNSIRSAFDFSTDTSIQYNIKNYMYNLQVTIVSYLNAIISSVEWGISSITSGLNGLVSSMNSVVAQARNLQYKRYSYGSYLYSSYLSRVSYPAYASGTVVPPNSAHLAVIGDNTKEPEVVSPVSTIKQAFKEAMLEIGGMSNGNVNVYLDGKQISGTVTKWQNRTNRAYGI